MEDRIYNTIVEVGKVVAQEYAVVCSKLFTKWEKDPVNRLTVWPANAACDDEMNRLGKKFGQLIPKKAAQKTTRFDVEYSEIQLYLQIVED